MIKEKDAPRAGGPGSNLTVAAGSRLEVSIPWNARACNPDGEQLVTVVDRRVGDRFEVHRRVIDDWRSVIGLAGIGLYALYCRLAEGGVMPGHELWASGGDVAQLQRLLAWVGLVEVTEEGILVGDPPARTVHRLAGVEERLQIAVSTDISPVWLRALACVKALLRGVL